MKPLTPFAYALAVLFLAEQVWKHGGRDYLARRVLG